MSNAVRKPPAQVPDPGPARLDRAVFERWVEFVGLPPYGTPEFDAEVRRQCANANESDATNPDVALVYTMADEMLALLDEEEANGP